MGCDVDARQGADKRTTGGIERMQRLSVSYSAATPSANLPRFLLKVPRDLIQPGLGLKMSAIVRGPPLAAIRRRGRRRAVSLARLGRSEQLLNFVERAPAVRRPRQLLPAIGGPLVPPVTLAVPVGETGQGFWSLVLGYASGFQTGGLLRSLLPSLQADMPIEESVNGHRGGKAGRHQGAEVPRQRRKRPWWLGRRHQGI
jgi:hypothetical protein